MKFFPNRSFHPIVLAAAVLLVVAGVGSFAWFLTVAPGSGNTVKTIEVERGISLRRITAELQRAGLVSSPRLFMVYARLSGADSRIKAGTYQFTDGMPPTEILRKMVGGEVSVRRFSIPEGYSIYQIGELLENRGIFAKEAFLRECGNKALLKEVGIDGTSAEGYLYPATYDIPLTMDAAGFVRLAAEQFHRVYAQRFASRPAPLGMKKEALVTLASMVEKEAVQPTERPLIASVFLNRLKKKMPLQSDPTAVYGVRAFAGSVTKQDIMRPSRYNTYLINGLPPGPIGNPGGETIEAVLNAAPTGYLYFVARKDGTHQFSQNLAEHNRAVRKYLKIASATAADPGAGYRNDYPSLTGRR